MRTTKILLVAAIATITLLGAAIHIAYAQGCAFNSENDLICNGGATAQNPYPPPESGPPKNVWKPPTSKIPIFSGPPITIPDFDSSGNPIMPDIWDNLDPDPLNPDNSRPTPTSTGDWCSGGATGTSGDKIADGANKSIGASTAVVEGTQDGALGCAIAVSYILECSCGGVGQHLSTITLYNALDSDPCYEKVDTGSIDGANLQPGDILVTKAGTRAGHTGIYVGGGNIVSNSSAGFQGSDPGTVQQNYTTGSWSGVTSRNPGGSAVFRRTCAC